MVSRLDRLFILLDSGSNESVRIAAAKQLGEVQRVQPNDLRYLLARIKEYSKKPVWETRVAAGHAIRSVLENVERWPPTATSKAHTNDHGVMTSDDKLSSKRQISKDLLEQNFDLSAILRNFDLDRVMSLCPVLLSSNILPDEDHDTVGPSKPGKRGRGRGGASARAQKPNKEQLLRQRQLINKELGIAMVDSLNLDVKSTDIVSNDDLQEDYTTYSSDTSNLTSKISQPQDITATLKEVIPNYVRATDLLTQHNCISSNEPKPHQDELNDLKSQNKWPILDISREYIEDLSNPSWEIRHGAAIALREIVKIQGMSAGTRIDLPDDQNHKLNQLWLIDTALKSICILALDRFGDFLFDQVVAPVRENVAQLLGCCVACLETEYVEQLIRVLVKMLKNPSWETRHGGILGLKYSLSVLDKSVVKDALQYCFNPIYVCLSDSNDDVSAEAAASLVPVKDLIIETIPDEAPKLIKSLWDQLAELDELTSSTSNIILLLAALINSSSAQLEPSELIKSIPKLWPLLSHSSSTVRMSVLKALITLIKLQGTSCSHWMPDHLLTTALRLIFQRCIIENVDEVRSLLDEVWMQLISIDEKNPDKSEERLNLLKATSQYLNYWLCLAMQPQNSPIDRGNQMWLCIRADGTESDTKPDGEVYIASCTFNAETSDHQKTQVTKCRLLGTKLMGALYANLVNRSDKSQHVEDTLKYLSDMFIHYIKTKSANQRMFSSWTLESWAKFQAQQDNLSADQLRLILPYNLITQFNSALQENLLVYDELATSFTRLQQETRDFVEIIWTAHIAKTLKLTNDRKIVYNLQQIQRLCDIDLDAEFNMLTSKKPSQSRFAFGQSDTIKTKQANLGKSLVSTRSAQRNLSISVLSSLSCAMISWNLISNKLDLMTNPLLDSIELEEEPMLQEKSILHMVILIDFLCSNYKQQVELIESISKRLIDTLVMRSISLGVDPEDRTLTFANDPLETLKTATDQHKIILLDNLQRMTEHGRAVSRRHSSVTTNAGFKRSHQLVSSNGPKEPTQADIDQLNHKLEIKHRGVVKALRKIIEHFGSSLPEKLPSLWASTTSDVKTQVRSYSKENGRKVELDLRLIRNLSLLHVICEHIHTELYPSLLDLFNHLIELLTSTCALTRHHSAQCIGLISKLMFDETIPIISDRIVPMLEHKDVHARSGSVEAVALIVEHLSLKLVPKINIFIVPILRRMSDQNDQVRLLATHCFGRLLSFMPLNSNSADISDQENEKSFIDQLLDTKNLASFTLPFETSTELRSYQQDGLNWLAFMNRFNLHGILCDEMGLGKTLMTLCMVASDHFNNPRCCPSLIVCPPTLTEHWLDEMRKFIPEQTMSILSPAVYAGSMSERQALRSRLSDVTKQDGQDTGNSSRNRKNDSVNMIITSYDILRNDIEFFRTINWNYCVLDEGHIIKNGKTKLSKAIRFITASHRLILSGTPIQNNVTELWSLFDFLMPGFLGSERQFYAHYAKPILQSREPKCSSREMEAGALAMESLHRQVLPFILRRLKVDVLDDLPPKILQDYYCELSPLQSKLYEDFTKSRLCENVTKKSLEHLTSNQVQVDVKTNSKSHIFQALQYLKQVCNHPKLVLSDKHSQYSVIKKELDSEKTSLDDINHSAKLKALKQLLIDCGIGSSSQSSGEEQSSLELESIVNPHRALVFCQLRSMVSIIEEDLFKKHLPSVTYLRLDGSIPPNQRQSIVTRFNNDPSIDVLLLTTQIGGLGLNLTGADTVIFIEHDWNPTKDLQAMDRAHRIGQKKVVNVYRLITKGTLEEKIMGLQKFKTMVSNTVINQDNRSLGTMGVDQLLDLFNSSTSRAIGDLADDGRQDESKRTAKRSGAMSFVELLPELWDQQQYENEYDLSSFVASLKNNE